MCKLWRKTNNVMIGWYGGSYCSIWSTFDLMIDSIELYNFILLTVIIELYSSMSVSIPWLSSSAHTFACVIETVFWPDGTWE